MRQALTDKQKARVYVDQVCENAVSAINLNGAARLMNGKQIAAMLGIAENTWCKWKKQRLGGADNKGGGASFRDVVSALYKSGYRVIIERPEPGKGNR